MSAGFYYFMALPFIFAIAATVAAHSDSPGLMWIAIGGISGCMIAGALSVGRLLVPTALVLLSAGVAQLGAVRPGWRALTMPLWGAVGMVAVPLVFLGAAVVKRLMGGTVIFPGETRVFNGPASIETVAPFVIVGSWLF